MASTIPGVLDYLVAAVAALADDRTLVVDGQPVRPDAAVESDYIAIGYTAVPDQPAVTSDPATYFGPGFEENYEIVCEIYSWTGDAVTKTARDRAFTLLDMVVAAVLADASLGGRVMSARPAAQSVEQAQDAAGSSVAIPFSIQVSALQSG